MSRYTYVHSAQYGAYKRVINKKASFKKKKARVKYIIRYSITFLFMIAFTMLFLKAYNFFTSHPMFSFKDIEIKTISERTENRLKGVLSEYKGKNFFLLNFEKLKKDMLAYPEVKEIVIKRKFPSTLSIFVKERVPFIILKNKEYYLLDVNGGIIDSSTDKFNVDVPVVFFSGGDILNLLPIEELRKLIESQYYHKDMKLYFIEPYGITVINKKKKIYLGEKDLVDKWKNYLWLKERVLKSSKNFSYIDLRLKNRIFCMPLGNGGNNG